MVFQDLNGNSVYDEDLNEPGLEGVTVFLDFERDGFTPRRDWTRTTDASGHYSFTNMIRTSYRVVQTTPTGWIQTYPPAFLQSARLDPLWLFGPKSVVVDNLYGGDGHLDMAVIDVGSAGWVTMFAGNGDGTFQDPGTIDPEISNVRSLDAGDVDGDGHQDLLAGNRASTNVSVLLGNGDGTFNAEYRIGSGHSPWALAAGDEDGDGSPEWLAVANHYPDTVTILSAEGDQGHTVRLGNVRKIEDVLFGNRAENGGEIRGQAFRRTEP